MMPDPNEVERELDALRTLLAVRNEREPFTYFLSTRADRLPHLRTQIDQKLAALGSTFEQEVLGDEDFLGLIADLIEYRIALFNVPTAYYPAPSGAVYVGASLKPKGADQ